MSTNAAFKLQDAGFTRQQVEALDDFMGSQVASKVDLLETEHRLDVRIARIEGDLTLLKWMMGLVIAGIASLVIKSFF